jgi:hypothetical protein
MPVLFDRIYDFAWPDFRRYNEEDLRRYLLWSLGLFIPLLAYYSWLSILVADATAAWVALAYTPEIAIFFISSLFVGVLGTRVGGCFLEVAAVVFFKLSFWGFIIGGDILQVLIAGAFLWYSTNLARACFALANERYSARW